MLFAELHMIAWNQTAGFNANTLIDPPKVVSVDHPAAVFILVQAGVDLIRSKFSAIAHTLTGSLSYPVVYVARKFPSTRTKDNDTLLIKAIESVVGADNLYVCMVTSLIEMPQSCRF